jgi:hypothetical protein
MAGRSVGLGLNGRALVVVLDFVAQNVFTSRLGVIILRDSGRRIFKRPTRRGIRHMLQDAILQCETSTKFTSEARPRRVGPKRRGRAHESRSRFVDMDDQWTFQCEIQKRHPLRDET